MPRFLLFFGAIFIKVSHMPRCISNYLFLSKKRGKFCWLLRICLVKNTTPPFTRRNHKEKPIPSEIDSPLHLSLVGIAILYQNTWSPIISPSLLPARLKCVAPPTLVEPAIASCAACMQEAGTLPFSSFLASFPVIAGVN